MNTEEKLIQKLRECVTAIKCCGHEVDRRGIVFKPEIGIAFLKSIQDVINEYEKKETKNA